MSLICLFKTIYRTLTTGWLLEGIEVSGHDFIEMDDGSLKCEICGAVE